MEDIEARRDLVEYARESNGRSDQLAFHFLRIDPVIIARSCVKDSAKSFTVRPGQLRDR
jgi:hypothetical protein